MSKQRLAVVAALLLVVGLTPRLRAGLNDAVGILRIDKPKPVTAGAATNGAVSNRPFEDALAGMLTPTPTVTLEEPDTSLAGVSDASRYAGFPIQLVTNRPDAARISGIGARTVSSTIALQSVRTILDEAGRGGGLAPATLDHSAFVLRVPRAVRVQYGNCPVAAAPTIQGQLQGPPPPTPDNGNCLALFQSRPAATALPQELPIDALVDIALELSGMSPKQSAAYRRVVDWPSSLVVALPRGIRSYDTLAVQGRPAMLINTAARRGPAYALIWQRDSTVFLLTGFGNAADAPALAESVK